MKRQHCVMHVHARRRRLLSQRKTTMLRFDSRAAKALVAIAAVVCVIAAPTSAALAARTPQGTAVNSTTGVPLSSLLSGAAMGIVVGDKIFTGSSYSALGDMPAATDVTVLGFSDPAGHWGVSFQGSFRDL